MKIAYVVPGPMDMKEVARRGAILREWAAPDTEVVIRRVEEGPASIESMYEEYLSIPSAAEAVFELEQEGYNAAILGCAGDPGLDAMREITSKMLVVGPGQTSYQTAAMLCHRFSVLTIAESMIDTSIELGYKAGVLAKLASVRAVDVPVLELANDRAATMEKIIAEGRAAVKEDRAQALVLGCMSMGFLQVAEEVQETLGIPVVNPSRVALATAEALVRSGLSHSKMSFALPPKLATGKVKSLRELSVVGE
ncbi:MAG TPA: hypothetical protein DDZ66_13470 [Firmicutes bacterium]|nr:hypothetical protein [Bacillota bacterium]